MPPKSIEETKYFKDTKQKALESVQDDTKTAAILECQVAIWNDDINEHTESLRELFPSAALAEQNTFREGQAMKTRFKVPTKVSALDFDEVIAEAKARIGEHDGDAKVAFDMHMIAYSDAYTQWHALCLELDVHLVTIGFASDCLAKYKEKNKEK